MMDKAVEDCIASIHKAEAGDPSVELKMKLLHDFVATSLPKSRHQVLMDASSTLVLSVHHHNPTMRRAAVNQLGKRLGAKGKVRWVDIPQAPPLVCSSLICSSLLPALSSFLLTPSFLSMNSSPSPLLNDPPFPSSPTPRKQTSLRLIAASSLPLYQIDSLMKIPVLCKPSWSWGQRSVQTPPGIFLVLTSVILTIHLDWQNCHLGTNNICLGLSLLLNFEHNKGCKHSGA